jgi:hypothetical protein
LEGSLSIALLKMAHRVTGLPAMARQVLTTLADEARDYNGDRSSLTTAQIADRTGLSRRTIHRAYVILTEAGHITRIETAPGAALATKVHPQIAAALPKTEMAEGCASVSDPPANLSEGANYIDITNTHSPRPSAREVDFIDRESPVAAPVPGEPVDQVFAAWDAWRDRAGLPGPVTRTAARRVAVDRAVRDNGLGKVLMMIDTIEREVRAGNFRRKGATGQDSIWATFDAAFEIGHAAGLHLLTRLLDGDFGALTPRADPVPVARPAEAGEADRPEPERRLRAALAARLGARESAVWIDPLCFEFTGDGVEAVAPGAFHADHVTTHFAAQLRRAAQDAGTGPIRVRAKMRERV